MLLRGSRRTEALEARFQRLALFWSSLSPL
jgi:hypothetical protein